MLLAVDIGNTNITLGLFRDETLCFTGRLATRPHRTADQYAFEIKNILEMNNCRVADVEDAVISSVVPEIGRSVGQAIVKLCNIVPLQVGPGVKTGLDIRLDNPAQLGADLAVGAVGAIESYTMPCIVIDMGTATTISVLDKNGKFLGGTICAGVGLTMGALVSNTSQLPSVALETPPSVIGKNTVDSMKSGIVLGTAAMIDGMIDRIEDELGESATVVATGGLSPEIINNCRREIIYNENLLLDGLRIIYSKNL